MHRRLIASLAAGALWALSGGIVLALQRTGLVTGDVGVVLPATATGRFWMTPDLWPAVVIGLGTGSMIVLHALIQAATANLPRRARFIGSWFAVIAAGSLVGLALDLADYASRFPPLRAQEALQGLGENAAVGAYAGVLGGWIVALIASGHDAAGPAARISRRWWALLPVGIAMLAAIVLTGSSALHADQAQVAAQAAADSSFDDSAGAAPDPDADGDPVPTSVPATSEPDAESCTSDQATLLFGGTDAAVGHRTLWITYLNSSDVACVVDGYPDIAFADQNDHLLPVDVTGGSSYLATDAGPARVEIPPGGEAIAHISWDANSTQGALVARTLFAAPVAGEERGSWPVEGLDIVPGTAIEITAWALDTVQQGDDEG